MKIRKATLEEWFIDLQLQTIARDHFHTPFTADVPFAEIDDAWQTAHGRTPVPSIVIRAVAELGRRQPGLNRMLFRTPLGMRIVEFDDIHVNVPVIADHEGRTFVSAVVIKEADTLAVDDINNQLRDARTRPVSALPINRLFLDGKDTLLRRLRLRATHHLAYKSPRAYVAGGGGALSVSSLHHRRHANNHARGVAIGPNSLTALVLGVHGEGSDRRLHLGLTFDHALLKGDEVGQALSNLGAMFDDPGSAGLLPPRLDDKSYAQP